MLVIAHYLPFTVSTDARVERQRTRAHREIVNNPLFCTLITGKAHRTICSVAYFKRNDWIEKILNDKPTLAACVAIVVTRSDHLCEYAYAPTGDSAQFRDLPESSLTATSEYGYRFHKPGNVIVVCFFHV